MAGLTGDPDWLAHMDDSKWNWNEPQGEREPYRHEIEAEERELANRLIETGFANIDTENDTDLFGLANEVNGDIREKVASTDMTKWENVESKLNIDFRKFTYLDPDRDVALWEVADKLDDIDRLYDMVDKFSIPTGEDPEDPFNKKRIVVPFGNIREQDLHPDLQQYRQRAQELRDAQDRTRNDILTEGEAMLRMDAALNSLQTGEDMSIDTDAAFGSGGIGTPLQETEAERRRKMLLQSTYKVLDEEWEEFAKNLTRDRAIGLAEDSARKIYDWEQKREEGKWRRLTEIQTAAGKYHMPESIMSLNMKEADKKEYAERLAKLPSMLWLARKDPYRAAIVHENIPYFASIADAFRLYARYDKQENALENARWNYRQQWSQYLRETPQGASMPEMMGGWQARKEFSDYGGLSQLGRDTWLSAYDVAGAVPRSLWNGTMDLARNLFHFVAAPGEILLGEDSAYTKWIKSVGEASTWLRVKDYETRTTAGRISQAVFTAMPDVALQYTLAMATGGIGNTAIQMSRAHKVANAWAYTQIAGNTYRTLRENGVDPQNAFWAATVNAGIQSRLENYALFKTLANANVAKIGNRYWIGAMEGAKAEALTEAAQQIPESMTELYGRASMLHETGAGRAAFMLHEMVDMGNFVKMLGDAAFSATVGGLLGGLAGATSTRFSRPYADAEELLVNAFYGRAAKAYGRTAIQKSLDTAMANAQNAPASADRAALRELYSATIPQNMREMVIETTDLANLLDKYGNGLAITLNMDAGEIQAAIENGQPLQVDTVEILSANDDIARDITRHLRTNSEGMNAVEADQFDPDAEMEGLTRVFNMDDDLQGLSPSQQIEELARQAQAEKVVKQSVNAEAARIRIEMEAAGISNRQEISAYLDLFRQHAWTLYNVHGWDPTNYLASIHFEAGSANPDGSPTPMGQAIINNGQRLIRLFSNRNAATLSHESAHIFVDDLVTALTGDGKFALQRLVDDLPRNITDAQRLQTELQGLQDAIGRNNGNIIDGLQEYVDAITNSANRNRRAIKDAKYKLGQYQKGISDTANTAGNPGLAKLINELHATINLLANEDATSRRLVYHSRQALRRAKNSQKAMQDFEALASLSGLDPQTLLADILKLQTANPEDAAALQREMEAYRQFQEKCADAFVEYMRNGKAPSAKLATVFARVKNWLGRLYRNMKNITEPQVPENVRQAFDRMLATEDQILAMAAYPQFIAREESIVKNSKMDAKTKKRMQAKLRGLKKVAERELAVNASKNVMAERERLVQEYYDSLADDPLYKFLETYRVNPDVVKLPMLGFGPSRYKKLKEVAPEIFDRNASGQPMLEQYEFEGESYTFTSMYERIYTELVTNKKSRRARAEAMADAHMKDIIEAEAGRVNVASARAYDSYLRGMDEIALMDIAKTRFKTQREAENWVKNVIMPKQAVAAEARRILNNTPLNLITTSRFKSMVSNALKAREDALQARDIMAMADATNKLRIANKLLQTASEVRGEAWDVRKRAMNMATRADGTFPSMHLEALRKVIETYDLARVSAIKQEADAAKPLRTLANEIFGREPFSDGTGQSTLAESLFPEWLLDLQNPNGGDAHIGFSEMTPSQISDLGNLLDALAGHGRNMVMDNYEKRRTEEHKIAIDLAEKLNALPEAKKGGKLQGVRKLHGKMAATVEHLHMQVRKADGLVNIDGKGEAGTLETIYADEVLAGEERKRAWNEKLMAMISRPLHTLARASARLQSEYGKDMVLEGPDGQPILAPQSMREAYSIKHFTPDNVIAIMLNLGNESNIARVFRGYPDIDYETAATLFGDAMAQHINKIVKLPGSDTAMRQDRDGLFTLQEWKAVQGIWDALQTMWPDIQAEHEKMHFFRPKAVEHTPFTIAMSDGSAMTFTGGYYPIKYDEQINNKIRKFYEEEGFLALNESVSQVPAARRGFTKSRTDGAPELPVKLNTLVLAQHLDEAMTFICLGNAARKLDRITQFQEFQDAYARAYGKTAANAIRPNIRGLVLQERPHNFLIEIEHLIRPYFVRSALWMNFKVAAIQASALFSTMNDINAANVMSALKYMAMHRLDLLRQVQQVSPYIYGRTWSFDMDVKKGIGKIGDNTRSVVINGVEVDRFTLMDIGLFPMQAVDQFTAATAFVAAYISKMEQLTGTKFRPSALPKAPKQEISPAKRRAKGFYFDSRKAPEVRDIPSERREKLNRYQPKTQFFDTTNPHHAECVKYANMIVKQSNPDLDRSSLTALQRDEGVLRLFSPFSSATSLISDRFEIHRTAYRKGKLTGGEFIRYMLYDFAAPTMYMMAILGLIRGYGMGEDKDKEGEVAKFILSMIVDQSALMLPFFGKTAGDGLLSIIGMKDSSFRAGGIGTSLDAPVELLMGAASSFGNMVDDGKITERHMASFAKSFGRLFDLVTGTRIAGTAINAYKGIDQYEHGRGSVLGWLSPRPQ